MFLRTTPVFRLPSRHLTCCYVSVHSLECRTYIRRGMRYPNPGLRNANLSHASLVSLLERSGLRYILCGEAKAFSCGMGIGLSLETQGDDTWNTSPISFLQFTHRSVSESFVKSKFRHVIKEQNLRFDIDDAISQLTFADLGCGEYLALHTPRVVYRLRGLYE